MNYISYNQKILSNSVKDSKINRKLEKQISADLYIPNSAKEMTYDDMQYVQGSGYFKLTISCTAGGLVAGAIDAAVGYAVSTAVNKLLYPSNGFKKITLINIWLPWVRISYNIDVAEKFGSILGGFGAASLAFAAGYALGIKPA